MEEIERFVAEDADEIIWMRLNRLKSEKLCKAILNNKIKRKNSIKIDENIISKKATGVSSAIESAIGFWKTETDSLNSKVLSRYYALLQMTIAEQVSSISNADDLSTIQRHVEYGGHGLGTIPNPEGSFPDDYHTFILRSGGHFHSYAKFLGYDTQEIGFERRPRDFKKIENKDKLISLSDLFRRIPELQPVIREYLGKPPLSFHIGFANKNLSIKIEKSTSTAPETEKEKITYIEIYPKDETISLDYIESLNLPFKDIKETDQRSTEPGSFIGKFKHPATDHWQSCLGVYKSAYCGTSYICPLFNTINDPILLHLMLLYSLSIIVRYLPDLWYEINTGDLNHIGSLIDYYLSMFDHVVPLTMLERITDKRIMVDMPGSLFGPT